MPALLLVVVVLTCSGHQADALEQHEQLLRPLLASASKLTAGGKLLEAYTLLQDAETAIFMKMADIASINKQEGTQQIDEVADDDAREEIPSVALTTADGEVQLVDQVEAPSAVDSLDYSLRRLTLADAINPSPDDLHIINELPRQMTFPITYYRGWSPREEWRCEEINHIPSEEEFLREYVIPRKPVKIRMSPDEVAKKTKPFAQLGWGVHKWDDKYLSNKAGDVEVSVEISQGEKVGDSGVALRFGDKSKLKSFKFSRFLEKLRAGDDGNNYYLNIQEQNMDDRGGDTYFSKLITPLKGDFDAPSWAKSMQLDEVNLWLGDSKNSAVSNISWSPLHFDTSDNLYSLLQGRKYFNLYSPFEIPGMYLNGGVDRVDAQGSIAACSPQIDFPSFSSVDNTDLLNGSYKRFPCFSKSKSRRGRCELEVGDMLYLPTGWMHEVGSIGAHMALNLWFKTPTSQKVGVEKGKRRKKKVMKVNELALEEQVRIAKAIENAAKESKIVPTLLHHFRLTEDEDLLKMAQDDDGEWSRDDFLGEVLQDYVQDNDFPVMQRLGLIYMLRHEQFADVVESIQKEASALVKAVEERVGDTEADIWMAWSARAGSPVTGQQEDLGRASRLARGGLALAALASPLVKKIAAETTTENTLFGNIGATGTWSNTVDQILSMIGVQYMKAGLGSARALPHFEAATRMHPHRDSNWFYLGRVWMEESQYEPSYADRAEYCLLRCLQLSPEKQDCIQALTEIYSAQGRSAEISKLQKQVEKYEKRAIQPGMPQYIPK